MEEELEPEEEDPEDGLEVVEEPDDGFEIAEELLEFPDCLLVVMITVLLLSCHSTSALRFSETNRNGTKVRPFAMIAGFDTLIRVPFL